MFSDPQNRKTWLQAWWKGKCFVKVHLHCIVTCQQCERY